MSRTRARITRHDGREICRVDVASFIGPVWARTSRADRVLFIRLNNSTRAVPDDETTAYIAARWPE